MAVEIIGGAEAQLSSEALERLGADFRTWVEQVEDDRRELVLKVYNKVQENLDGRAPIKSFPWLGASNAFAPLTGTYADALQSRLFEAATAQDPTNLVLPRGQGDIIEDYDYEKWADAWQRISRWAERDDYDHKSLMETVTLLMTHYGDAWVYIPWEEQEVMDVDILKGGELQFTSRTLYSRPAPKVIHPKDFYIRWDAPDHQTEPLVGFQWDLDIHTLAEYEAKGLWDEKVVRELREVLQAKKTGDPAAYDLFSEYGTPTHSADEYEEKQKRLLKLAEESSGRTVKMMKMFARADLRGKGTPCEYIFDVVKETGRVAAVKYANYYHRQRPLIHFWFKKRPGSQYNIGVGELMINPQDIINTLLRDHCDNNKIQNTSVFLLKKNSGIKQGKRLYPSATYWVNDPKGDVVSMPLGPGSTINLQGVQFFERLAQYIVGLSDYQLGEEPKSRTPASTIQSAIQQASVRPRRIIEVMRKAMRQMHHQILMLYFQNGEAGKLAAIAAVEDDDREKFMKAMGTVTPEEMAQSLVLDSEVSSDSINRDGQLQKGMALFAQLGGFWDRIRIVMQQVASSNAAQDPVAASLALAEAQGYVRAMKRVLNGFEERDQREILPEGLIQMLEGVTSVEVSTGDTGGEGGQAALGPSPAQAAQGLVTSEGPAAGPVAPEGRPIAGQPRIPIGASVNGGERG